MVLDKVWDLHYAMTTVIKQSMVDEVVQYHYWFKWTSDSLNSMSAFNCSILFRFNKVYEKLDGENDVPDFAQDKNITLHVSIPISCLCSC